MVGKKLGYVRVSSYDQNPDRQLAGLELDKKFIDYTSGKNLDRPQLRALMDYARDEDIIYVHSMDRLARNVRDLRKVIDELIFRKISIVFLKESASFIADQKSSPMGLLMLHIMGAIAEFEWSLIKERQREGIEVAKRKGTYRIGRTDGLTNEMREAIRRELKTRKTLTDIAFELGIKRTTLHGYIRRMQVENEAEIQKVG